MLKDNSTSYCKQKKAKQEKTQAETTRVAPTQLGATRSPAIKATETRKLFFLHHIRKIPGDATGAHLSILSLVFQIVKNTVALTKLITTNMI